MTKELCLIIDQLSREKGIPREMLLSTLESALLSAARKRYGGRTNVNLRIDPKTCAITVFETKKIVEAVTDRNEEISPQDAAKIVQGKALGDEVEVPIYLQDFGRIAAQTAKQVIFQRVREAERDVIFKEFKDKVGHIVSGVVMRKERGIHFLSIGKAEAILLQKESLPGENLKRGDTVRAYIEDVRVTPKGPVIYLSRTDPNFVLELFKMEVPEITEGLVVIRNIVREPGERTKIAVVSKDHTIDPVGACVGMKGTRVQSIVRELRGERIDIIPWTDDPRILISRALSPASVDKIGINEEEKTAMVVVNDQQLSLAIGKKGQNVKLAMKLTGWDIDILSDSEYAKMRMEETDSAQPDSLKKEPSKKPGESGKSQDLPE
ncbi:MAG TPA: transcription termination factor NusA [Thermodesulfovibrionales bacterium]|nr:transcription termination factor NusA [Thermodesulfovibrionales bacterium]